MINKPPGYECSRQPQCHPSIYALLPWPVVQRGVQSVGRLDQDSSGLLLFSDDGQFIHRWSSGKKQVPKVYRAWLSEDGGGTLVDRLLAGVGLNDEPEPIRAVSCRLIEPRLLDFVNSELRAGYELANQVLLQYDPVLVDDPLAIRGWLVGTRLTQTLDRSGGDLSAARDVRAPNPISAGEIACGTNPTAICAADIMFFGWNGSTVEGPMVVVDGLAEPVAQTSGVAPTSG